MNGFDIAAVLITVAAISGFVNHKVLKLPATSGTLVVALASSLLVVGLDALVPSFGLDEAVAAFVGTIDFNETLMHGMLAFLLFAGALHVDLEGLWRNKWTIAALATVGVLISTAAVGIPMWWVFQAIGAPVPLVVCLAFGALISPTDPVAVMGLLKELAAPADLEAQIAGESLFNDGVGVVVFLALVSLTTGPDASAPAHHVDAGALLAFFLREVAGGIVLGLVFGYCSYRALMSLDDHPLELLITLGLAMFTYAVSFWIHVSGPIAVVVAGLLIGNPGRRFAMSARTREHVDGFWSMVDEILNAVLFLLLGLEVFTVRAGRAEPIASLAAIAVALGARYLSVAVP